MFADLNEFLDGRCPITVKGKTYYVAEPNALAGLRIQRMFIDPTTTLDDAQETAEIMSLLGPVWDEMNADGVGYTKALFAGRVALIYYAMGPDKAAIYASGGIDDPGNPLPREEKPKTSPSRGRTARGIRAAGHGTRR